MVQEPRQELPLKLQLKLYVDSHVDFTWRTRQSLRGRRYDAETRDHLEIERSEKHFVARAMSGRSRLIADDMVEVFTVAVAVPLLWKYKKLF